MKRSRNFARVIGIGVGIAGITAGIVSCGGGGAGNSAPITKAQLGKDLFFDASLSSPSGMSCATCHSPARAFTDPRPASTITSEGVVKGLFGFRKAPSVMYMAYSPEFSVGTGEAGGAIGGQFWDGRAPDLQTQATFPMQNPIEMNGTITSVVKAVQTGPFAGALKQIYGPTIFSNTGNAFHSICDAIATFERLPSFSPFTSKYDAFLKGTAQLAPAELRGLDVFNGKAGCAGCHTSSPAPDGTPPLFTNFCYANLGLPKNPKNPYYTIPAKFNPLGANFIDIGLQVTTNSPGDAGNFMTPTLRNVAVKSPFFHNGYFSTLAQVVHFYNTRDLGGFPAAEIPQTEDTTELGNLQLTTQEEADVVSFLGTLTDGYSPPKP